MLLLDKLVKTQKKRGTLSLLSVPRIEALALPNPEEQTTTVPTLYYICAPKGGTHKYHTTKMIQ